MSTLVYKAISAVALTATFAPSLMLALGACNHQTVLWMTLAGTIVWFVATPAWMGRELPIDSREVEI